jgi:hypothetical protein
LTLDGQLEALLRASPQEKQQLAPIFRDRYNRDIDKIPEEDLEKFLRKMAAAGLLGINEVRPSLAQQPLEPPVVAQTSLPMQEVIPSPSPSLRNQVSSPPSEAVPPPQRAVDPCRGSTTAREERPANGYEFEYDQTPEGHGKLTVNNGNAEDAAVILSSSIPGTLDRLFYVRGRMEATITEIPPGRYRIVFQIGRNWDSEAEMFRCVSATAIFDKEEAFEERTTATDVEYSDIHITLHKVVGGNARTTPLNPNAFRRHRRAR